MKTLKLLTLLFILFVSCKKTEKVIISPQQIQAEKVSIQDSITNSINLQMSECKNMGLIGVEKMERYLDHQFDSLDVEHKQLVFLKFQEIYLFLIDKPGDEISNKPEQLWSNGDSIAFKKFDKFLNKYGARISYNGEGSYYINKKADYLYNLFKGRVSETMTYYLRVNKKELEEGYQADAGLVISFEELYKRVVTWEDFINKNPNFILINQAKSNYKEYFNTLLTGTDNSPIYDYETKMILPEIKSLYEKIIKKNEARNSTRKIADLYNKLKNNNFKEIEEISSQSSSVQTQTTTSSANTNRQSTTNSRSSTNQTRGYQRSNRDYFTCTSAVQEFLSRRSFKSDDGSRLSYSIGDLTISNSRSRLRFTNIEIRIVSQDVAMLSAMDVASGRTMRIRINAAYGEIVDLNDNSTSFQTVN